MKKNILLFWLGLSLASTAGLVNETTPTGFKLQLETETYLTDTQGVASAKQMITVPVGKLVRIYRTDGFYYTGQVTEVEESDTHFKIYGKVLNVEDTQFGFVLAKGGVFAGAVVEKEKEKTYVLEFSEAHKGFVLVRSTKYNKPGA
jgi:hypothetical protein